MTDDSDSLISRSYYLLQTANYEEAIRDCSKVIESEAKEAVAYNNRAKALMSLSRHNEALTDLTAAIELNSEDYPNFFYNLGCTYTALQNYREATAQLTIAIKMNDREAKYYQARAESYEKMNDIDAAEADRQTAAGLLT